MAQKSHGSQHGTRHKLSSGPREKVTVNERLKQFEEGEKVRIDLKGSVQHGRVHNRFHGRTGEVKGMRGDAYRIQVKDDGKSKQLFIKPVHLEETE
ncbi:MAG: 50S ribosomal protein L21e [Candidatus Nanohaloarchaea archaeon]